MKNKNKNILIFILFAMLITLIPVSANSSNEELDMEENTYEWNDLFVDQGEVEKTEILDFHEEGYVDPSYLGIETYATLQDGGVMTKADYPNEYGFVNVRRLSLDGKVVYCLEPEVFIDWGLAGSYNPMQPHMLSPYQQLRIWEIIRYGYGYGGHTSENHRIATQIMIWETVKGFGINSHTNIDGARNDINNAINNAYKLPNFNANTVEFEYGDSFSITDSNNILGEFNVSHPNGFDMSVSGNTINLTNNSLNYDKTISVTSKSGGGGASSLIAFGTPGSQTVGYAETRDPNRAININLKMLTGTLLLQKYDEFGNNAVAGQEFAVWRSLVDVDGNPTWEKDIQLFAADGGNFKTDANGLVTIEAPGGFYIIEEVAVTNPYELSSEILYIEVINKEIVEVEFKNDYRRINLDITKIDSEDNWKLLNGATYTLEDITNYEVSNSVTITESHVKPNIKVEFNKIYTKQSENYVYEVLNKDIATLDELGFLNTLKEGYTPILIFDDKGNFIEQIEVLVTNDLEVEYESVVKEVETIQPSLRESKYIFKGTTGTNYIHVVDNENHFYPIANATVKIYRDPGLLNEVETLIADEFGMINVNHLSVGTYFYTIANQENEIVHEFMIYPINELTGKLSIDNLKWGREYRLCEVGLPEGYDYLTDQEKEEQQSCIEFNTELPEGEDTITYEFENILRRLDVTVIKVDEDNNTKLLNGATFEVWDITDEGKDIGDLIDKEFPTPVITTKQYIVEYISGALLIEDKDLIFDEELNDFIEIKNEGIVYKISLESDMSIYQEFKTNSDGEILEYLQDGIYYVQKEGEEEIIEYKVGEGKIYIDDLKYGHEYMICETKAPAGYNISENECSTFIPTSEYGVNIYEYILKNKKIEIPNLGD